MNPDVLKLLVLVVEMAAKLAPGLIVAGKALVDAIANNDAMTPEQKVDLVSRVEAARKAVAAYEPKDV